jgi:tyrosinase
MPPARTACPNLWHTQMPREPSLNPRLNRRRCHVRGVTRRSFISAAGAIPFAVWCERFAFAQATFMRHDATSVEGRAALKTYANAVAKMMASPESNPLGWVFQWYIHAVRDDHSKADEIARIYPAASPAKDLATDVWDTCQAHFDQNAQPFFLPWHRMYLYFFERIVRKVSGDKTFALPYWDYSTATPSAHGVIPKEFRLQSDPAFKALFRADRNRGAQRPDVNAGQPIDRFAPGTLSLAALKQGSYLPHGALTGFNQSLDGGLHGNIHVLVGNSGNMGSIPWAARDPLFWVHHCNIDRVWASWNRNGGRNPVGPWLSQTFVFSDENGSKVVAKVDDFKALDKLGYAYDRLEPAPPGFSAPTTGPGLSAAPTAPPSAVFGTTGPVALGAAPTTSSLQPKTTGGAAIPLPGRASGLSSTRRAYLVLRNLKSESQPGVLYNIYVSLPRGVAPTGRNAHHAGTVNFFDSVQHLHTGGNESKFVSFDITEVLRDLQSRQLLTATPTVTFAPVGQPAAEAKPVVGEISVVEQ